MGDAAVACKSSTHEAGITCAQLSDGKPEQENYLGDRK
jgi:hypothetical protein